MRLDLNPEAGKKVGKRWMIPCARVTPEHTHGT